MRGYRMALLRSGIDKVLLNVEGFSILVQLLYDMCKERRDERKKAQEERRDERKKVREEIRRLEKKGWRYYHIPDAIKTQIDIIGEGKSEDFTNQMIYEAYLAERCLRRIFFYMTNPDAVLVKQKDVTFRQFINGVAQLVDFGKIYDSEETADLTRYDIFHENFEFLSGFVISIEEIKERGNQCKELIASRKEQMAKKSAVDSMEGMDLEGMDIESIMDQVKKKEMPDYKTSEKGD